MLRLRNQNQTEVQTVLALECKKRNYNKIFHSRVKLIATDSDIDEAFQSMHQSIITKIKKSYAGEDWVVLNKILEKLLNCIIVS